MFTEATLLSTPTYPTTDQQLETVRSDLLAWDTLTSPAQFWRFRLFDKEAEVAREYALAIVSLKLNDSPAVARHRSALESMTTTKNGYDPAWVWLQSLDALVAFKDGAYERAIALISESVHRSDWRRNNRHLIHGLQNNILVRAESEIALGRLEDALATFRAMRSSDNRIALPYYGLVYYRSGQLLEELGRPDEAMEMYSRLLRLWQNADPQYQSYVEEAKERLDRLAIAGTREPA
jgi:tetratricopeptide (TPR) repeat protein